MSLGQAKGMGEAILLPQGQSKAVFPTVFDLGQARVKGRVQDLLRGKRKVFRLLYGKAHRLWKTF